MKQHVASTPLFDPWLFFMRNPDVCLPSTLTHYIYHHYPTDSCHLAEVALHDLAAGRIDRAEQLFSVGAIPSLAPEETFAAATAANLSHIPRVSSTYASERLLSWKPTQAVLRKVCSCGFDASAAALAVNRNSKTGPSHQAVLLSIADSSIDLLETWQELTEEKSVEYSDDVQDMAIWGECKRMQHWMLPFNGTVGRYPFPFSNVQKTLARCGSCQHVPSLTRDFVVEYVQSLYHRFVPTT